MITNTLEPAADWATARRLIQVWLADNATLPSALAQQAGIHRSILSRFQAGKALDAGSAMKLFAVVQRSMASQERIALLEAMGLLQLALILRDSLGDSPPPAAPAPLTPGRADTTRLLAQAYDVAYTSCSDAIALYEQAERACGPRDTGAPRAAMEAVQMLLNLSDFDRAEVELARIQARYASLLDADLERRASELTAWLYFGRRDLEPAVQWFTRLLEGAQEAGSPLQEAGNLQFLGWIYTLKGQRAGARAEADGWYHLAEHHLQGSWMLHARHHPDERSQAWDFLRLGQLHIATGSFREAREALRRAKHLLCQSPAVVDVGLAEAEMLLREGETRGARRLAEIALPRQAARGYAQGMARSARVLTLAGYQECKPLQALENAIAAMLFNPHISLEEPPPLSDLVTELSREHLGQAGGRGAQRRALFERLRERALERRGIFAHLDRVAAMSDAKIDQLHAALCGAP